MTLEEAAQICHDIWAHWMRYMITMGQLKGNGSLILHSYDVDRWKRLMETHYSDLTYGEKCSDREVARRYLGKFIEEPPECPADIESERDDLWETIEDLQATISSIRLIVNKPPI